LGRMLLEAAKEGCLEESLAIASLISSETIWHQPRGEEEEAEQKHRLLYHPAGDHMTLLTVWRTWEHSGFKGSWLQENFLRVRAFRVAKLAHQQLRIEMATRLGLAASSCAGKYEPICWAFVAGYFCNSARRCGEGVFHLHPRSSIRTKTPGSHGILHPSSALARFETPHHVIFNELVCTSKPMIRSVLAVEDQAWLNACRASFDDCVTPELLCGRPPPPTIVNVREHTPEKKKAVSSQKRAPEETVAIIESARMRFEARKRAKAQVAKGVAPSR
jgi:ATP-dependent RNA helicase DHX8/PRP22